MADGTLLSIGALFTVLHFITTFAKAFLPDEFSHACRRLGVRFYNAILSRALVYIVEEYEGANRNELYEAVELHLNDVAAAEARRLRLMQPKNATSLTYSLDDCEGVVDVFKGRKIWWDLFTIERKPSPSLSWDPPPQTSRFLNMRVHRRDRAMVMSEYLPYVLDNAKALKAKRRERKLYTNSSRNEWFNIRNKVWDSIPFKHPATFGTLALDPLLKQRIMDDLLDFKNGEQFYKDAGRAWKRGYLLYGPPGTGKSSMIASIANFLEYDVYDLELGEVKSNVNLKGLLLEISDKALVVIEDIDCSLDLSRTKKKDEEKKKSDSIKPPWAEKEDKPSEVTLSGVLNLIDGLWSSCGNERIFVFTTNHIEKLDEALIRSGRMDMHIHLSFCGFEAVKLLAKNYLKLENHFLFEEVQAVMQEDGVCMTPSDVYQQRRVRMMITYFTLIRDARTM
ncbi:hypothetical protein KP509_37G021200 [Ceratopteris richardii]|uniref:AAA+ ATPase domain-containing protein n=1 Tax=Ceratopteris richardii TaxID=49495 RepID=A0A8T2Q6X7_CERRI|nr:hypothetical protein KP509_37G021200 [Ceratopteris richardii]